MAGVRRRWVWARSKRTRQMLPDELDPQRLALLDLDSTASWGTRSEIRLGGVGWGLGVDVDEETAGPGGFVGFFLRKPFAECLFL